MSKFPNASRVHIFLPSSKAIEWRQFGDGLFFLLCFISQFSPPSSPSSPPSPRLFSRLATNKVELLVFCSQSLSSSPNHNRVFLKNEIDGLQELFFFVFQFCFWPLFYLQHKNKNHVALNARERSACSRFFFFAYLLSNRKVDREKYNLAFYRLTPLQKI